jgi:hypothetical protein
MRQRLGIAAALLGDPSALMFDESFNGMDPEGIIWMRGFQPNTFNLRVTRYWLGRHDQGERPPELSLHGLSARRARAVASWQAP